MRHVQGGIGEYAIRRRMTCPVLVRLVDLERVNDSHEPIDKPHRGAYSVCPRSQLHSNHPVVLGKSEAIKLRIHGNGKLRRRASLILLEGLHGPKADRRQAEQSYMQ